MSDQLLRTVLGAVLLLHGLGHGGALGALAWVARFGQAKSGDWTAARSWLLPGLDPSAAMVAASVVWAIALVGFVATALAFLGIGLPVDAWRGLALASALVSAAGIAFFLGTWPMFNTLAGVVVNGGVLVALAIGWPPASLFTA